MRRPRARGLQRVAVLVRQLRRGRVVGVLLHLLQDGVRVRVRVRHGYAREVAAAVRARAHRRACVRERHQVLRRLRERLAVLRGRRDRVRVVVRLLMVQRPRGLEEGIAVHYGAAGGTGIDEQALVVVVGRRVGLVVDRRRQDERENGGDCR